ncbi:TIGR02281 family clan AA aspartic protease [soil metagenome]
MSSELPHSLKVITVWLLAGLLLFLGVQWWQHRAQQTRITVTTDAIEIRRGDDGHYHWPGRINGRQVEFLVDTGATGTAIPSSLARELKLEAVGTMRSSTAGGMVTGEIVVADIQLQGGVQAQRLRIAALPALGDKPLLGMDVLGRLRWQQRDGVLRIEAGAAH